MNRFYVLAVVVVALVVYGRMVTHEHVLDDRALIPHQVALQTPFDVGQIVGGALLGRFACPRYVVPSVYDLDFGTELWGEYGCWRAW